MSWYKIANRIIAYHGTSSVFDSFNLENIGNGHDQDGPGIYFTDSPDVANVYVGKENSNIRPVVLMIDKAVLETDTPNKKEIEYLILQSMNLTSIEQLYNLDENIFYESSLSDWSESPIDAFYKAVDGIIDSSQNAHEAFQSVWYDFYRHSPKNYIYGMIELGYDGVIVPKENHNNYIMFNLNKIQPFFNKENK